MTMELWHGAHNTFVVALGKRKQQITKRYVKNITKRYQVDGFMQIAVKNKKTMMMQFFNPDGTPDNCGNGLRVAAQACFRKGLVAESGKIISRGQEFKFRITPSEVNIVFPPVKRKRILNVGGVKHLVMVVEDFEKSKKTAPKLRKKYKCNITLVKKMQKSIFAQTFEMGVERFTAACGTGAIAAAIRIKAEKIFMPGGMLKVQKKAEGLVLSGPTQKIKDIKNEW